MRFGKAQEMFQIEALAIGMTNVTETEFVALYPPNQQPEGFSQRLSSFINGLNLQQIEGRLMHGTLTSATHQQGLPLSQTQGQWLSVARRQGKAGFCLWGRPGVLMSQVKPFAVPTGSGGVTAPLGELIEDPIAADTGNHYQV
jgi:hypothetical protein